MKGRLHDAKRNDRAEVGLEVLSKNRRDWVAKFRTRWGSRVQQVRDAQNFSESEGTRTNQSATLPGFGASGP